MSRRGAINAEKRKRNLPEIIAFLDDHGLPWNYINGYEWHIRVENQMDIFPTRKRYHFIKTGARGGFSDYEELGRTILERFKGEI